jgi:type I restriction enzyme M protein
MLSPRIKSQVDDLWKKFWSSGLTNPLTSIEQITYLLFLKQLEVLDSKRKNSIYGVRPDCQLPHHPDDYPRGVDPGSVVCPGHPTCRWSTYISQAHTASDPRNGKEITPHYHLTNFVFPWLRELDKTLRDVGANSNGLGWVTNNSMSDAQFQLSEEHTGTLQTAIATIDELFDQVGKHSANADIMGDIFEYLLTEITTSGKNGQFRTPRHIIRFMIELLDPKPGDQIIDPAAGTGGFLINSLIHLRKQATSEDSLLLEWDGTPHRAFGGAIELEQYLKGLYFTGYDNDRTMVRIGWMNMILHEIDNPRIRLRDTLGKNLPDDESNKYDYALANPPFTGNVDKLTLHGAPRIPRNQRNLKEPITDKTELLFLWLMFDLLKVGSRAAVIVPEGVLFGSTGAHRELRRQLLMEHRLESVISLPAGVFQPYTGVKTSILIFQKVGETLARGDSPVTEEVWFYEVTADGYTLDAKRTPKPEDNDLWDALEKWPGKTVESTDYFQPDFYNVRWRDINQETLNAFPDLVRYKESYPLGNHELFPGLPRDPDAATAQIKEIQIPIIRDIHRRFMRAGEIAGEIAAKSKKTEATKRDARKKAIDKRRRELERLWKTAVDAMLEPTHAKLDNFGRKALRDARDEAEHDERRRLEEFVDPPERTPFEALEAIWSGEAEASDGESNAEGEEGEQTPDALAQIEVEIETVVREFAKLDGYNVMLRTHEVKKAAESLTESRSWTARVRVWSVNEEWRSEDGKLTGSHDENGQVRPEYIADESLYNDDGTVKAEHLDPLCIEANDLNLAAGRYKPFNVRVEKVVEPQVLIRELRLLEIQMQRGLKRLNRMVGSN